MVLDKDFNLIVGLRIREIREAMHMTRETFSELCGISDSFLAAVESGKKSITSKTLYKICSNAHISADYIILGNNTDFEADTIIELLKNMSPIEREHAFRILSEYSNALNASKQQLQKDLSNCKPE